MRGNPGSDAPAGGQIRIAGRSSRSTSSAAQHRHRLDFDAPGPTWFGAGGGSQHALVAPGFTGRVASGASCNCSRIDLTPHCNGTHTECAGHLTARARWTRPAWRR